MDNPKSKICSISRDAVCNAQCERCGWSFAEIERRKKLPLVKFKNGLYGKYVGKNYAPIGESLED